MAVKPYHQPGAKKYQKKKEGGIAVELILSSGGSVMWAD